MSVVQVEDLVRGYRTTRGLLRRRDITVAALRGVSFEVREGEVFGALGPNGAGKTTLIKILTTLLLPDSGTVRILGHDVVANPKAVRPLVGYVFGGDRGLYDRLSAYDNLRYFAELYGIPVREQRSRIGELLERTGLTGREHERVEGFSRGMRQRLHIARGLIHKPAVLFLDEPTIGLDPVGARELRDIVSGLKAAGTTVFLTTHYMLEADLLCDRLLVMSGGAIAAAGTPDDLKLRARTSRILEVELLTPTEDIGARVRKLPTVSHAVVEQRPGGAFLVATLTPGTDDIREVLTELTTTEIGAIQTKEPTLEDAYVEAVSGA